MSPHSYYHKIRKTTKTRIDVRKHWKTYLGSICLALLSGCAEHEVLVPTSHTVNGREVPISFAGSFVDYAATRHANRLSEHLPTMGVWGWRNSTEDDITRVFDNQLISYNGDSARWEYSPLQYWRMGSRYDFYAYAPHQIETGAEVDIHPETHMISIHHATLHGHNLQDEPTDTVKELFRGTPDTDWMIAREGQTAVGKAGMDVEFMMQHILGKLNVCIKACPDLLKKRNLSHITADSIVIGSLAARGDFVQQLTHTPILSDPAEAAIDEWTVTDTTLQIRGTHACRVAVTPTCLVESLVLPQHIPSAPIVTLYYSYRYADGHTEECRYRMALNDAFSRFASGYNHTLTFTLCPSRITFEAGTVDWVAM